MKKYILEGKDVIECDDVKEWGEWFEKTDRQIALTEVGDIRVSTVFIGLDHNFGYGAGGELPIVFETMVFKDGEESGMRRYSTWNAAAIGHVEMCKQAGV